MHKLNQIIQIVFLIFFAFIIYFGVQKAYSLGAVCCLIAFAILTLIPVLVKDPNILKFKASFGKMVIEIFKDKIKRIVKSNKSDDDKIKESQKLIDETFKLGYEIGSGRVVNNIQNVKFTKNKDSETTNVQFDEN